MSSPLYRAAAVNALAINEQLGRTLHVSARVVDWALAGGVLALLCLGGLAYGFSYEARTTVSGYLEPIAGQVNVRAPQDGVVRRLKATEGATVEQGEILFILDTALGTPAHSRQAELIGDSYAQEMRELQARRVLYEQRLHIGAALIAAERESIDATLAALAVRQRILEHQRDLRQHQVARLAPLAADNVVPTTDLAGATLALHAADAEIATAAMERAALQGQLTRTQLDLLRLQTDSAVDESNLATTLENLQRRVMENAPRIEIAVRAPIQGMISAPQVIEGQRIAAGAPALSILGSSELRAVLFVPSHAAGFVKLGQTVQIRYDAFAYEKYGVHRGSVREISSSTLETTAGTSAYRILVGLRPPAAPLHLKSGMTIQADLLRDRRRLYEWLLAPALQLSTAIVGKEQDA